MLMAPTDKICTKTKGDAVTNASYISEQEIKLVYAIHHSYKQTDPELQQNTVAKKNHPVASITSIAN